MITIQNLKEKMKGYTLEITDLNILTGDIFGIYIDDLECKERLINLISLLEIPSKGNIKIGGIDTNDKRYQTYLRRKIGVITKNLLLIDNYNVELNIPKTLKAFGINEEEFKEKVAEIAKNAVGDACTGSNPRSITPEQMEKLLTCTYYGTEVDF